MNQGRKKGVGRTDHLAVIACIFATGSCYFIQFSLSGVPDYFYRNKISSGGDLSHYSSASLY